MRIGKLGDLNIEFHLTADKGENVPNESFNNLQKYKYAGPGTMYLQEIERAIRASTN